MEQLNPYLNLKNKCRKEKMKKMRFNIIALVIIITFCGGAKAQTAINYGSNNGKYISVDNTKIYYEEYGKGVPLLMLHGGFSSINNFQNSIPELAKHYRVIAIDLPGSGRSPQADSMSFQLLADYVSKAIDLLKLDSAYVYGYSMGGIVALHLAADKPNKIKRSVVHAAGRSMDGYMPENAFFLTNVTPEMCEGPGMKWWLDDYKVKSPNANNWKKYVTDFRKMFATKPFIVDDKLRQIKNPVLLIQGDQDAVRVEHGLEVYRLVKNSQFCVLPATTHFALWGNTALINKLAVDFLR